MALLGRSPQALQLTLALIKPDAVAHPLILEAVHQQILSNKFLIVRMRELLWRKEDCQRFYQEHEGRFFYQRLVEFMARRGLWNPAYLVPVASLGPPQRPSMTFYLNQHWCSPRKARAISRSAHSGPAFMPGSQWASSDRWSDG
ncbi:nucleoside diphosphate kinase 6 isoform X2 [Tenrec ecaudatus]|uniref:nucleoside diphosphate kinase 6 isoform X2 n=1 Tax=Tenrec ecaudatus TaxID=94439 RepID=UPI003F5917FD